MSLLKISWSSCHTLSSYSKNIKISDKKKAKREEYNPIQNKTRCWKLEYDRSTIPAKLLLFPLLLSKTLALIKFSYHISCEFQFIYHS